MSTLKLTVIACCLCLVVGCAQQDKAPSTLMLDPAKATDGPVSNNRPVSNALPLWPLAIPTPGDRTLLLRILNEGFEPSAGNLTLSGLDKDFANAISLKDEPVHAGVIVPHHLVAITELAATYQAIQAYNPDFIILLSPNHQKQPSALVTTAQAGILLKAADNHPLPIPFDGDFVKSYPEYRASDQAIAKEHGLYHQLPFILRQNWDAKILPLALARNLTRREIDTLKAQLLAYSKAAGHKKVLWLASIDFSHYLPAADAHRRDLVTQEWILEKNFDAIAKSTESSLDAPAVLTLMALQFEQLELVWHGNSATKLGYGFNAPGTSYMIYLAPPK